jgi:hypothetical protein
MLLFLLCLVLSTDFFFRRRPLHRSLVPVTPSYVWAHLPMASSYFRAHLPMAPYYVQDLLPTAPRVRLPSPVLAAPRVRLPSPISMAPRVRAPLCLVALLSTNHLSCPDGAFLGFKRAEEGGIDSRDRRRMTEWWWRLTPTNNNPWMWLLYYTL